MKAKESAHMRHAVLSKQTTVTLDDVDRLSKVNRKDRRIAEKLLRKAGYSLSLKHASSEK